VCRVAVGQTRASMCITGDAHQTSTQRVTETYNSSDAEAAAKVQPNLPTKSSELILNNSLSVFLLDWDDTLFPTTALTSLGPERVAEALEAVDTFAVELLAAILATPRSRLVILTNAKISWVHHCAETYMPKLNALLGANHCQVLLISAHRDRSQFATYAEYEHAVRHSKSEAVRPLSTLLQHEVVMAQATSFQVISVGDQPHDLAAAHALRGLMSYGVCGVCEQSFVKTVAMKPQPAGMELAKQLDILCKSLPKVVNVGRHFHLSMCQNQSPSTSPSTSPSNSPSTSPSAPPPVAGAPALAVEAPAVEAPAVEAPAVEAPAVEAPAVEEPDVEAIVAVAPVATTSSELEWPCLSAHNALDETAQLSKTVSVPVLSDSSSLHNKRMAHASAQPSPMLTQEASMAVPRKGQCQKSSDVSKRGRRAARQRRACAEGSFR